MVSGVPISVPHRPLRGNNPTNPVEACEFLACFDAILARFRPDVLVGHVAWA
jgi:hypothetical protein